MPDETTVRRRVELAGLDPDAPLVLLVVDGVAEALERELYGHLCVERRMLKTLTIFDSLRRGTTVLTTRGWPRGRPG